MSTLTDDIQANADLFILETQTTHQVWGLKNDEGWLSCDSVEFEESEVMPFWSSRDEATKHNVDEWADFIVTEIPLDVFTQEWLVTLDEDGVLIGLNWNENLDGKEMEPKDVAKLYL